MKYYSLLHKKTPHPKPWDEATLRGTTRIPENRHFRLRQDRRQRPAAPAHIHSLNAARRTRLLLFQRVCSGANFISAAPGPAYSRWRALSVDVGEDYSPLLRIFAVSP